VLPDLNPDLDEVRLMLEYPLEGALSAWWAAWDRIAQQLDRAASVMSEEPVLRATIGFDLAPSNDLLPSSISLPAICSFKKRCFKRLRAFFALRLSAGRSQEANQTASALPSNK